MTEIDKIIRTLDLTQSDAREETLAGIIKFIVYSIDNEILQRDIPDRINKEFSIEVHKSEIQECIDKLVDKNLVEIDGEKIKLSSSESLKIRKQILENDEDKNSRFLNFSNHIQQIALEQEYAIIENEVNILWESFLNYL